MAIDLEAIRLANEYRRKYLSDGDGAFVLGLVRGDNVCEVVDALLAENEHLRFLLLEMTLFVHTREHDEAEELLAAARAALIPPSPSADTPARTTSPPLPRSSRSD